MNVEKILKAIVRDKKLIKYHTGWGFYIETKFEAIHMIGLIPKGNDLELSFYFGDTQKQSRSFYNQNIDIDSLKNKKWELKPHFHFSSTFGENLIWFDSKLKTNDYVTFWKNNTHLLYRHKIEEIPNLVNLLSKEGVILINEEKEVELATKIYNLNYSLINICAGFGALFKITNEELNSLINTDDLSKLLVDKINEGLKIIGENGDNFLIDFNDDISIYPFEECQGDPDGL